MRALLPLLPSIFVMLASAAWGAASGHGAGPASGTDWAFREHRELCLLERPVRDFGTIRFVGAPGTPLRLEILGHRDVFAEGAVNLYRVTPAWHPEHPYRGVLGETRQRAGSGLLIGEPLATQVLMALYDGFEAELRHAAWYGGEADLRIPSVHLRPRYDDFARCLRDASARGWSAFERTRIEYPSGGAELSARAMTRLRRVVEYVRRDPAISRIYVDGHTDDVGGWRANLALSRQRAEAVAGYLEICGVGEDQVVVRYHGGQYPVSANTDAAGRAENRRTTVRLERRWTDTGVAHR